MRVTHVLEHGRRSREKAAATVELSSPRLLRKRDCSRRACLLRRGIAALSQCRPRPLSRVGEDPRDGLAAAGGMRLFELTLY